MKKNRNKFPEYLNPKYFKDYKKIDVGKSLAKTIFLIAIVALAFIFCTLYGISQFQINFQLK